MQQIGYVPLESLQRIQRYQRISHHGRRRSLIELDYLARECCKSRQGLIRWTPLPLALVRAVGGHDCGENARSSPTIRLPVYRLVNQVYEGPVVVTPGSDDVAPRARRQLFEILVVGQSFQHLAKITQIFLQRYVVNVRQDNARVFTFEQDAIASNTRGDI